MAGSFVDGPRLLFFGAHPDDAEFSGGLMSLYCRAGYTVKVVSVTDGAMGHQSARPEDLRQRRLVEAHAAAQVIGADCSVWQFPDGRLEPTLELRECILGEMRRFRPDLVLTHRPLDYHPDHRAVGQAVMDAAYLVTVPLLLPEVPALSKPPVIAQVADLFTKPSPLDPQIVIDVAGEITRLVDMLHCHTSQVYEWLPFNRGELQQVPGSDAARKAWLEQQVRQQKRVLAQRFYSRVLEVFGDSVAPPQWVEVYELSEYGARPDAATLARLFPWHGRRAH